MLTRGGFCRVVMRRAAISAWGKLYPSYSHSHSHSHRHLPLPLPWQNLEILLPSFPQNNNNNRQRLLFHFPFVVLQCRNFLAFDFDTAASNGAQRCHLTNKERNSNNNDDEPKNDADCLGNSKYIKGQSPCHFKRFDLALEGRSGSRLKSVLRSGSSSTKNPFIRSLSFYRSRKVIDNAKKEAVEDHSQSAVVTAMWCNFMVFSLKSGVWMMTSSHVMLAEVVHSAADLANQALLAYGLSSSRRAPDALHPYGYSKERFVWSLISAVGIFCLGCGATIVHGIQHLWDSDSPTNVSMAAVVIGGSFIMEGISLLVALRAVRKGAAAEGMKVRDYVWRGHDPTSVAVMMEDGAAVTGLLIAAASLVAVKVTGNPIYDPLGSILVGHLLGMVAIFLIQRNRQALIGRAIDPHDMARVLAFLSSDPVVEDVYDCKSEVIGPGSFRFKAEIEFNGVALVQNYLQRTGREAWAKEFREAVINNDDFGLDRVMANYGEEVISALGFEVDRLEKEIQSIVPGIQHVDIETHNPKGPLPEQTF